MTATVHAAAADRLNGDGQRCTAQRQSIVDLLVEMEQPLTIPELLARLPGLAQSSAYRNLAVLERAGVLHRIVTSDEFDRYELAADLTRHHHLICATCGGVTDFEMSDSMEHDLEVALANAAREEGFEVRNHRLDLMGNCHGCR
jgi:Fe2+ or Zn2+ uptake regulation protein